MKLASLRDGTRDGRLIVVNRDATKYADARHVAPTLQIALDYWQMVAPALLSLIFRADQPLDIRDLGPPLPRAFEWVDGSAYLNHVRLVRKARGAEPPADLEDNPLIYQGGSGDLLGPHDDIVLGDPEWGLDFEAEVCAFLSDVPMGTRSVDAARQVRLLGLCNDVTLRNLVPAELGKGFGFFQSKPATTFAPFVLTPDELGPAWQNGRIHLRVKTTYNDEVVGDVEAGPEMHFSFADLIAYMSVTRRFTAGTILGSGTVSNVDRARGVSCLAEKRALETIDTGAPVTPFMKVGDRVRIEMLDGTRSLFGAIDQKVVAPRPAPKETPKR